MLGSVINSTLASLKNFIVPILNRISVHFRNWMGIFNMKVNRGFLLAFQMLALGRFEKPWPALDHAAAPRRFSPEVQRFGKNVPELGL